MAEKKVSRRVVNAIGRLAAVSSNRYHVMPRSSSWIVKRDGATRAMGVYSTKNEAIRKVKQVMKSTAGGYAYIHGRDGRIREELTYFGYKLRE